MISKTLIAIGVWLFSDAVYSYVLYANSQSWRGPRQTWAKDHWVRLVRAVLSIVIIVIGFILNE